MVCSVVKICSYDSNLSSSSIRTTSRAFWIEPRKRNYAISSYVCTRCKKSGEVEKEGWKLCSLLTLFAYLTLDEIKKKLCNKPIYYDLSKKLNYSDAYIKNLTKELFSRKYLIKQGKGVPGGLFSSKLIKLFNSQEFQQYL